MQLNEEPLSAWRPGVARIESKFVPAKCVPPWVAVGSWVLYPRLGHMREPHKGRST